MHADVDEELARGDLSLPWRLLFNSCERISANDESEAQDRVP